MELVIDLSDKTAIRQTYGDCHKWREKGGVLRRATQETASWDPTLLLPEQKWHAVLELGCGLKQWIKGLVALAAPNGVIYACDINEDILRVFSREFDETYSQGGPRHYCVLGDGESLPFAGRAFDGISAVFIGPHMKDAEKFVSGLVGILKADGWLLTNSVDWTNPPPDFPSQGLQRLLGEPARFIVRNAFDESMARGSLNRYFGKVREHKVKIPAILRTVEQLMNLHSRQEQFITRVLPPNYCWEDYASRVRDLFSEYLDKHDYYQLDLHITYFLAECPHE